MLRCVFFFGDFNYRLMNLTYDEVLWRVANKEYEYLQEYDQVRLAVFDVGGKEGRWNEAFREH
jgi:hypothetical protein